jgi:cob(I)alamin adenosyltransferase
MSEEFKIYTKTGDKGETSLLGGTRVPKFHPRIEAYGTVDELVSFIGLIRDQDIQDHYRKILIKVQDRLFSLESQVAKDPQTKVTYKLPELSQDDVKDLENEIDKMNEQLPELNSFILPGGHTTVSYCHIARTVCRRAERMLLKLSQIQPVDELNIKYLNRLSDYLFVLARKLAQDLDAEETPWKPAV